MQSIKKPKEKKNRKPRPKLQVVLDPGTSATKIIYCLDDLKPRWMVMGGEYISLDNKYADKLPKKNDSGFPEDNAWFQYSDSDKCHLIGASAKNRDIKMSVKKSKNILLGKRIVAAIGAISVKHDLKSFDLRLGVLVPLNEMEEIKGIANWKEDLKRVLSVFIFQGEKIKAKLKICQISPEGSGMMMANNDYVSSSSTAVIMMGYRNTSCLFAKRGTISIQNSGTSLLGYSQVIEKLKRKFSYIDEDLAIASIKSTISFVAPHLSSDHYTECENHKTSIDFDNFIPINFSRNKEIEKAKIKEAYEEAAAEYWDSVTSWLADLLPSSSEIDYFLFSGGTSYLFKAREKDFADLYEANLVEQNKLNKSYSRMFYSNETPKPKNIEQQYGVLQMIENEFSRQNHGVRFLDAWGFFLLFSKCNQKS